MGGLGSGAGRNTSAPNKDQNRVLSFPTTLNSQKLNTKCCKLSIFLEYFRIYCILGGFKYYDALTVFD